MVEEWLKSGRLGTGGATGGQARAQWVARAARAMPQRTTRTTAAAEHTGGSGKHATARSQRTALGGVCASGTRLIHAMVPRSGILSLSPLLRIVRSSPTPT